MEYPVSKTLELNGTQVVVRGLTYGEFMSIRDERYNSMLLLSYDLCKIGIVDAEIYADNTALKYSVEYYDDYFIDNKDVISLAALEILDLTILNEDRLDGIKSALAYSHFTSSKKERWECKKCILADKYRARKCSILTAEEMDEADKGTLPLSIFPEGGAKALSIDTKPIQGVVTKLSFKERKALVNGPKSAAQQPKRIEEYALKTKYYKHKTCPINAIDKTIAKYVGAASQAISNESMFVSGGILDQPNLLLEIKHAMQSFQNELHEVDRENDKKKHK